MNLHRKRTTLDTETVGKKTGKMASVTPGCDRDGEHIDWQVAVRKRGFPVLYKTFRTKAEAMGRAAVTESEMARGVFVLHTESEQTT